MRKVDKFTVNCLCKIVDFPHNFLILITYRDNQNKDDVDEGIVVDSKIVSSVNDKSSISLKNIFIFIFTFLSLLICDIT